jgi:nitrite reductase (NADH) small subunit/3-phenylpropionate/trans-cinnamate dioxygenase ferredoxin subunit
MAEFHSACRVEELAEGQARTIAVGSKLIAVFKTDGQYYAIEDVCPHMGASLASGIVEGGIVTCPWHAWRFRLADGAWADNPRIKIGCYRTRITEGRVEVEV